MSARLWLVVPAFTRLLAVSLILLHVQTVSPLVSSLPPQFLKVQSKPHDEVFKPQAADDLRGRI